MIILNKFPYWSNGICDSFNLANLCATNSKLVIIIDLIIIIIIIKSMVIIEQFCVVLFFILSHRDVLTLELPPYLLKIPNDAYTTPSQF